jgi:phosphoglycolate phosphatase
VTVRLDGIDLVIFDKDGTIIEFAPMWSGWAVALAEGLTAATGRPVAGALYAMLGVDPSSGAIHPGGGLAATPMARLRDRTRDVLLAMGIGDVEADRALDEAWHAPDPVALARPLSDLPALFDRLRAGGRRIAVATTDDRDPTERTLAALGIADRIEATVCADDGIAVKPAPDMVLHLCATLGVTPARTAVIGDTAADLQMARAAGAGLVVGVLTGVGERADLGPLADAVIGSVGELATPDAPR